MEKNLNFKIKSFSSFNNEIKLIWHNLTNDSNTTVFQTYDINKHWYETIGSKLKNQELSINVFFKKNKVVGIAPFFIYQNNFGVKYLTINGFNFFDFLDFLVLRDYRNSTFYTFLIKYVNNKFKDVDILSFKNFNNLLINKAFRSYKYQESLHIKLENSYQDFMNNLKPRFRRDSERQLRRIKLLGNFSYNVVENKKQYQKFIDHLIKFKRKRFKKTKALDIFNDIQNINFFKNLFVEINDSKIFASYLTIDNKIISCALSFLLNKKIYFYSTSFDQDKYDSYSINRLHMLNDIKFSFESNFFIYDFLCGNEAYKKKLSNESKLIYHFERPNSIKGSLYLKLNRLILILKSNYFARNLYKKIFR